MWIWSKVIGRALINAGLVVLGIVAAKELVDTSIDIGTAYAGGEAPSGPASDTHPIPPMA